MRKHKIAVAGLILALGLVGAVGVLILLPRESPALAATQWTEEIGKGIAVPACTSSAITPTCVSGAPSVKIDWSYNNEHGACTSATLGIGPGWLAKTPGPANSRMAYGVIANKLYIAQGSSLGTGGQVYDPTTNSWAAIAVAPAANAAPASAVANRAGQDRLYSFGTATHEFTPGSGWITRAAPPIDLSWGQAATVNNQIYVFSGLNNRRYDPAANAWLTRATPPRDHGSWPAVAQVGGIIYVIGGGFGSTATAAVDAYDPSTDTWAPKTNIPATLGHKGYASAVAVGTDIYVFGGGNLDVATFETWQYNTLTDTWTRRADMPTLRNVPAVGLINGKVYVYGGEYPGVYVSDIHEYKPAPATIITGLSCPPETNSYTWNGGASDSVYYYSVRIFSGITLIDYSSGVFTTPNCETLSVAITAAPSSGDSPLDTVLSADITYVGTAPTTNYSFWWDCNDPTTSVSTAETACGALPAPAPGVCVINANGAKCNGVTADPQTIPRQYTCSSGTCGYTAKVIAERGAALPAESRASISVSSPGINLSGAAACSPTRVDLSWTLPLVVWPLTEYHVERCTGAACTSFAEITTVPHPTSSYSDPAATDGTTYRYRVRGHRHIIPISFTNYSNIVTATLNCAALDTTLSARINLSDPWSSSSASAPAPLNDLDLQAVISGTQTGTANHTFYCDHNDSHTVPIESPFDAKYDNVDMDTPFGPAPASTGNGINFDVILGSGYIVTVIPPDTIEVEDVCDYPAQGTYYPKVVTERGTLQVEDRLDTSVTVTSPLPDLIISVNPYVNSGILSPGSVIDFKGTVKNQGGSDATPAFNNRFRIDLDDDNDPGSPEVTLEPSPIITSLGIGAEQDVVSASWTAVTGTHRMILCADQPFNVVAESNEANNCNPAGTRIFSITSITNFSANPSTINLGQNSTLSWTTSGFTSCGITDNFGATIVPPPSGPASTSGAKTVTPTAATTYIYTLTCSPGPSSATASVTVRGIPRFEEIKPP